MEPIYKRVLLKISGEALAGDQKFGISDETTNTVAKQIKELCDLGVETAIVVGGGNFWRGRSSENMDRATADYMGMLATVMNALALESALNIHGVKARVQTAIEMREIAEPYARMKAISRLERKEVVIFGAGTGNPYFTTDTAATLRAIEIGADVILKGTRVDGIYDSDPEKNDNAMKFNSLSFNEVIEKNLKVMDMTAFTLSQENNLPIIVFDMNKENNLLKIVEGEDIGTIVN